MPFLFKISKKTHLKFPYLLVLPGEELMVTIVIIFWYDRYVTLE
jgi:hypothetical protein